MVCIGRNPRGRVALLGEQKNFARPITMFLGNHAPQKRLQGRSHQGYMGEFALVENFPGQHFKRASGNHHLMPLSKMMIQLASRILQNHGSAFCGDPIDMHFGKNADRIVIPPQGCRPHGKSNRQLAGLFDKQKRSNERE